MPHKEGKIVLPDTRTYGKAIKLYCNHKIVHQWNGTGSSETDSYVYKKLGNEKGNSKKGWFIL